MRHRKTLLHFALFVGAVLSASSLSAAPLGTAFNYQGRLEQNGAPALNGIYQMNFALFADSSGGSPLSSNNVPSVPVTNGLFNTAVDFGPGAFTGDERWLQITVRTNNNALPFTLLLPRTRLAPTPYALRATTADTATNVASGAVTAAGLATTGTPANGQVLTYNGSTLTWQSVAGISGAWATNGNNAAPGSFFGTVNNVPLEFRANNTRALKLEPNATAANVIGGFVGNYAGPGVEGAHIGGGGAASLGGATATNRVLDSFSTVAGGASNTVGTVGAVGDVAYGFVGGGYGNTASGHAATIGGGAYNLVTGHTGSTIAGGWDNEVTGDSATIAGGSTGKATNSATFIGGGYGNVAGGHSAAISGGRVNVASGYASSIGGGEENEASAEYSTVGGGFVNKAIGVGSSTVGGGNNNVASGDAATVPGGSGNTAAGRLSFAAGAAAQALHDGSFVWADKQGTGLLLTPFESTGPNQFCIRAAGGVQLSSDTSMHFGSLVRQMLNLWGTDFGIGVQNATLYSRSSGGFAWFRNGSHNNSANNPGPGGATLMTLDAAGLSVNGTTTTKVLAITGGADLAEPFPIKEETIEKGSVVVIDKEHPGQLKRSTQAYDKRVAGIVSGANGINPGIALKQEGSLDHGENVALTGRVYVKADATYGEIEPGDLLTTSDTPGHAMKVTDPTRAQGAILGKAMSALKEGTGLVLVLVTLQ